MYTTLAAISIILAISALRPIGGGNLNRFTPQETLPLRGILAILIICTHFGPFYSPQWSLIDTWSWFGGPVVGCFFFLSGYGLAISYIKKGNTYIDSFLRKRFVKILPPFILMTLIAIAHNYFAYGTTPWQALIYLTKGITPLATSWYIYVLILFYLAFFFSAVISKSPRLTGISLIVFTLIYSVTLHKIGWGGWWISSTPSFIIGYYAASYQTEINSFLRRHAIIILPLSIITLIGAAFAAHHHREIFQPLQTSAVSISVYLCLLFVKLPQNAILKFLGSISYEIYLVQGFMFGFKWTLAPSLSLAVIFSTSIMGGWLLHRLFLRPNKTSTERHPDTNTLPGV